MSGHGEFGAAIDGLRGLEEVSPQYRHEALEVSAGVLEDEGVARAVELRAVPPEIGSTVEAAFTGAVQPWWSVSDRDGASDLLRWGPEPRPWALVADDGKETLATAWETVDDETATDIVTAVGETLAAASAEGVVHGNLRPAHVQLPEGEPTVLIDDWGLGRAVANARDGAFVTGFTAPEQLDGPVTDGAAVDTYGLAALAYFVLTERPPFPEEPAAILREQPRPVAALRPDLPGAVDNLVMRGLHRDPEDRPDSPGAFAAGFEDAMPGDAGGAAAGGGTATGSGAAAGGAAGAAGAAGGKMAPDEGGAEPAADSPGTEEPVGESGPLAEDASGPLAEGESGPLSGDDAGPLADDEGDSVEGGGRVLEEGSEPPTSAEGGSAVGGEAGGTDAVADDAGDSRVNRRTLLAGGGLLAALAAVGAGAWAVLGGGGGSGGPDLSVVPDRAETLAAVDVTDLRESDAVAGALNARLPLSLPLLDADTVAGVLDGVATRTGMDPDGVREAVVFAARSAGPETYAAAVLETEWDGSELRPSLEGAGESVVEETYADSRLLVAEYADLAFPVAVGVLDDGRYAVGTRPEVEDVLETASGSTPSVDGREVEAFRAATDGQVRVGSLLPSEVVSAAVPERVPEQVAAALTETARTVEYVSGSVGADGGIRLEAEAGSTEAAETAAAQLRAASTLAADELGGAEGSLATVARLLDEASVSNEDTTVTVSLGAGFELLAAGLAAAEEGAV